MQLLAWAPPAAPLPRRSEVETFWNSFSCDRSIAVLQSVPAFLLQTPAGTPPLRRKSLDAACFLESMETGTGRLWTDRGSRNKVLTSDRTHGRIIYGL